MAKIYQANTQLYCDRLRLHSLRQHARQLKNHVDHKAVRHWQRTHTMPGMVTARQPRHGLEVSHGVKATGLARWPSDANRQQRVTKVVICIDQRSNMFFSSSAYMKSVVATEVAALAAWHSAQAGALVGWLVAGDKEFHHSPVKKCVSEIASQLSQLSRINRQLRCHARPVKGLDLSAWLFQLGQHAWPDTRIIFISDWHDCTLRDMHLLGRMPALKNSLAVMISDKSEPCLYAREGRAKPMAQTEVEQMLTVKGWPVVSLNTQGGHLASFHQRLTQLAVSAHQG